MIFGRTYSPGCLKVVLNKIGQDSVQDSSLKPVSCDFINDSFFVKFGASDTMPETQSMMTDSYIGGIGHVSFVPPTVGDSETVSNVSKAKPSKIAFREPREKSWKGERVLSPSALEPVFNQTDEDKLITITSDSTDEAKQSRKSTNINLTEEYNMGYTGLSILPWENFVMNPRVFNDLFYAEKTRKITYDPDEVNVFFHGKNVLPPTVGDISENGKSW